jgi:ATP-dependent DNA helicase RecQ
MTIPSAELDALLAERFGIAALRDWQREAVTSVLEKHSRVLVIAPTGGGKSLCYQLPAVALPGTALVLSPLISLMEDQVRGLTARGIPATFIASSLPRDENARRLTGVRRGEYKVVYAAPERLAFDGFMDALAASTLSLVAIDEAHCIVQWGHDFRPDYLRIGAALARFNPPRVLACTATATPEARDEILAQLGWHPNEASVVLRGFARPNLHLAVEEVSGPRESFARTAAALLEALGSAKSPDGAAIVYAATRKSSEQIAEKLVEKGFAARAYHAGLDANKRADVSARFANRTLDVVVATNAFGMGIDRSDVRVVVHAQPPASLEAYYQEVGRAGRDGHDATGLLLLAGVDVALRRRLCESGNDGSVTSAAESARAWNHFRELLKYVDASSCRHDFILRYFGDEAEAIGGCGHCDVCMQIDSSAGPDALAADLDVIRRALAGVARAKARVGMIAIAAMLVGAETERVKSAHLNELSTFGVLRGKSEDEALRILRVLLANGWIDLTPGEYPMPVITPIGWRVMQGQERVIVRLPPPPRRKRIKGERLSTKRKGVKAATSTRGTSSAAAPEKSEPEEALFEELRQHRTAVARARGVPAYVVATDKTLLAIARVRPRNEAELLEVPGIGPQKMREYGEGLLDVVRRSQA